MDEDFQSLGADLAEAAMVLWERSSLLVKEACRALVRDLAAEFGAIVDRSV